MSRKEITIIVDDSKGEMTTEQALGDKINDQAYYYGRKFPSMVGFFEDVGIKVEDITEETL